MSRLKKFLAVLLAVAMLATLAVLPSFTASSLSAPEQLFILGLLKGDGDDDTPGTFEERVSEKYLQSEMSRMQLLIHFSRLLGFEEEAYDHTGWDEGWEVDNFADYKEQQYIRSSDKQPIYQNMLAYYYDNAFLGNVGDFDFGFSGKDDYMFDSLARAKRMEMLKALLTVMGYQEDVDFKYSTGSGGSLQTTFDLARKTGIWTGSTNENQLVTNEQVAGILVDALAARKADGTVFGKFLLDEGLIDMDKVIEAGVEIPGVTDSSTDPGTEPGDGEDGEDGGDEPSTTEPSTFEVTSVAANNFAEVELTFNFKIDPDSISTRNIRADGSRLASADRAYVVDNYGDGTILRIFKRDAFTGSQNRSVIIEVSGVKTPNGTNMTPFRQNVMFRDSTSPAIEQVIAKGNSRIDIYISEPLQEDNALTSRSTYKIDGEVVSGNPTYDLTQQTNTGRVISIKKLSRRMSAGEHELTVSGTNLDILDYAGNNMGFQSSYFTVVDDKEGPIAQEVLNPIFPHKVMIQFDKEITEDGVIYWRDGSTDRESDEMSVDEADPTIAIFEFTDEKTALGFTATTVYLRNVEDYWGNAAQPPTSFVITPVPDTTRPEVVESGSDDEGEFWVLFNKRMKDYDGNFSNASNIVIRNSKGDRKFLFDWNVDADDNKKILFKGSDLKPDTFSVTLRDFEDTSLPTPNKLLETTFTVGVSDSSAPEVVMAWWGTSNKTELRILFDEKVNSSTALDRANYRLFNGDTANGIVSFGGSGSSYNLPSRAVLTLGSGERLVVIAMPTTVPLVDPTTAPAHGIRVTDVEDLAGNKLVTSGVTQIKDMGSGDAEIDPTKVRATGKTTIKLTTIASEISFYDPGDFEIYEMPASSGAGARPTKSSRLSVTDVTLESEGGGTNNRLKLTLNRELNADATFTSSRNKVFLHSKNIPVDVSAGGMVFNGSNADVATIYDDGKTILVNDEIAPSVVDAFYGTNSNYPNEGYETAFTFIFDEQLRDVGISGNLESYLETYVFDSLTIDGTTYSKSNGVYAWNVKVEPRNNGNTRIRVELTSGSDIEAKTVRIVYAAKADGKIMDKADYTNIANVTDEGNVMDSEIWTFTDVWYKN